MAERMGVTPEECVFIDDQPGNLAGAEAVGMRSVHLDPVDPGSGFARARDMLGLG
jgi:putative hydrolase of the HAD superfamily